MQKKFWDNIMGARGFTLEFKSGLNERVSLSYRNNVLSQSLYKYGGAVQTDLSAEAPDRKRRYCTLFHVGPLHRNQRDFWLLLVTKVTSKGHKYVYRIVRDLSLIKGVYIYVIE